jgi:serine/threonine-protein kinase
MEKDEFAAPNEDRWLDVAVAIADGTPIDWSARSADPSGPADDGGLWMVRLQCLERLVRGHDAMRTSTSEAGDAPALDTLLTEARRAVPASDTPLRVHWGPLIVVEKIGRGSFGDVYRAWDPRLAREVALKLIPESASESAGSPVVEEGRLLARVRHPNVLTVHGAERIDGRVGIWTEYVRGETLAAEVARRGPLPANEAARIGVDVCRALGAVHEAGLLHRDVKAQNIMRDAMGRLVLGDFGTGVEFDEHAAVAEPQIAGTPLYLAPEIFDHGPATVGTDLYSVGVLLYFLATGNYPVRGRTFAEIKRAHAAGRRESLGRTRPDLPAGFVDIVEALLATGPSRLYGTAAAAEVALQAWLDRPAAAQTRRSVVQHLSGDRAKAAIIGAVVLVAVVAAMVWRDIAKGPAAPAPTSWALNAGDWIVIAAFENRTGEVIFDGTIEAAVKRELEYSDFLHVAQRARVGDALLSLDRPLDVRLDRGLVQQVSVRDGGIRAFVAGRVAQAVGTYQIVSDIVDPATRTTMATLTDRASQRSDVLAAVRRHTLRIREALGEPSSSIERSRQALEQAKLPTLKALHLYAQASMTMDANPTPSLDQQLGAERTLREAVEDDPTFARAVLQLAMANVRLELWNRNRNLPGLAAGDRGPHIMRYTERAFQLADTATPLERLRIIGSFHHTRTGTPEEPQKVAQTAAAWEELSALQPDDEAVMTLLQNCYRVLGRAHDAMALDSRLADARPRNVEMNLRVAKQLLTQSHFDGARRYALRAQTALSPSMAAAQPQRAVSIRLLPALAAWLGDNARETLRLVDQVAATEEQLSLAERREIGQSLWPIYAALGRIGQAQLLLDALRASKGSDVENQRVEVSRASFFDVIGDGRRLREVVAAWPDAIPESAQRAGELAYFIEAGRLKAAERELQWWDRHSKNFGRGGEVIHLNFAGAIELARAHHATAIDLLQNSMQTMRVAPADRGWSLSGQGQWAAPKLAEALEKAHRLPEAIAILQEAGARRNEVAVGGSYRIDWWMRHYAQLGRLYRKNGQTREAEAVEAHLLKLLTVADPDYPLLLELRARQ